MSRLYIQPSWVDACSDHKEWSGQSPDDRKRRSQEMFLPNGQANTALFTDEELAKKHKEKRSAFQQACLADNNYERLQRISEALDDDLESGALSVEDWAYAKKNLQPRIDRAWKKIADNRGWEEDEQEEIDSPYQNQQADRNKDERESFTPKQHCPNIIFKDLSDDNFIKKGYLVYLKLMKYL